MTVILQNALPVEMLVPHVLPGVAPCGADDWLRVDEAYAAQMAYRIVLMADKPKEVLWLSPDALPAAQEVLHEALGILPPLGFDVQSDHVICPDDRRVSLDWDDPLRTMGHLMQQDVCLLEKRGTEHVLTGAVLCFPASWRLADKVERPLSAIHDPVAEYDESLGRRVQRMFDGVRAGRPLWRFNRLNYVDADLYQPVRKAGGNTGEFTRSERQCILRLPRSNAVAFTIHTYVVPNIG
ncbi:DUF3445 domain-containing protein [Sulfitobacter sp. M57]|uniref:heme-dependent oxidative N-demethylase family protein n=1 Tax=unclassified Sulfitobacter TaxID=196795 RepID=UPI0023E26998|nr:MULTISPECIES: DUF3445 domain-containing protein [unclassified Sulfitobacter]MDF3413357.1 DUF3445 domain-containing protein [Sulfitobacter sp. KE5]MDF3421363.1 DUF3445 domain-containing protein [Sulfitobacter sp. KE43]MDF3431904.1 DUF3445 domain-containing protein [Sulfitobacter sp. KE42]MDF3457544.1 DUF3445 domain-containing protein [Sulfitobacter sp. S74]MDF3461446.1 DUF3445 domain-containing protein [Sulfitobacter sp. Ks18]